MRYIFTIFLMIFCLSLTVSAQDDPPPPQFLYRRDNQLVLLNGYTGEETVLLFEVASGDHFEWSLDGRYLLARIYDNYKRCINVYDVDGREWLYTEPIECGVEEELFAPNPTAIIYLKNDGTNGELWQHNFIDHSRQKLHETYDGDTVRESGLRQIELSPTKTYLTFVDYHWIVGGTLNTLFVINMENLHSFYVEAGNTYYASYHPIWSPDDRWFLIQLKEQYLITAAIPYTNHQGDVYLVNSETGEQYRLTYTPADEERDIRWLEDGSIAFTEVKEREFTFTPEEAMAVVAPETIVMPQEINSEDYERDSLENVMVSPDPEFGAWISSEDGTPHLSFGAIITNSRTADFSVPIPDYEYGDVLFGWRPSDYPYPHG